MERERESGGLHGVVESSCTRDAVAAATIQSEGTIQSDSPTTTKKQTTNKIKLATTQQKKKTTARVIKPVLIPPNYVVLRERRSQHQRKREREREKKEQVVRASPLATAIH